MTESRDIENTLTPVKKYTSLSRGLVMWFLVISLIPMSVVSWIGYQQADKILKETVEEKLEQSAVSSREFIRSWFKYRFSDINNLSQNSHYIELLKSLKKNWRSSGLSLAEYTKSNQWVNTISADEPNFNSLNGSYDYIQDVFLIDNDGNILLTIKRKTDLGTNLFKGVNADSKFADSVKKAIETEHITLSNLERYSESRDIVTVFLSAPLFDMDNKKQGVFAIQISIDHALDTLNNQSATKTLKHYLVGSDGALLTKFSDNSSEILNRVIRTDQFKVWSAEHASKQKMIQEQEERAFNYLDPNGKAVIGIHNDVNLLGVNWVLISEIEQQEAFVRAAWLGENILVLFFVSAVLVFGVAIVIARRITRPVIELADVSMKVAEGDLDQQAKIHSDDEIGRLAESFNYMIQMRQLHEKELLQINERAQIALADLDEQRFALDQHAIVAITDVQGNITYVNQKFIEISGYSKDELLGKNHRLLNSGYHDKSFFIDMYKTISGGGVWHAEIRNRAKDGKIYWVDTTVVPFHGNDKKAKGYISIRSDITYRKVAEENLKKALEAAEIATQLKSDFLANMSHEIRTPMNGVIGMTGLLLDTELNVKQREFANNTMKSAEALLTIINDILDFSKIEAGKMELEEVPFDLRELCEDVAELMALKCREKNIEMLLRYKPGSVYKLVGDPGRVRQILLNLVSNSVKFTDAGSVVLSIETHQALDEFITVLVSVKDTGLGIEEDKLDKIFNKFDQEDGSTTRKYGGTGLGLAICRQLCNLMDGDIVVRSSKGEGSTFSFTMNLRQIDEMSFNIESEPEIYEESLGKLKGLRTLIVDDLDIARTILREQLSGLDLVIDTAVSGKEALSKLGDAISAKSPYDIVITDFYMPEMDGEKLVDEIKRLHLMDNGVVVFITSSPRENEVRQLKEKGFDGYLTKPTHPAEVPRILSMIWNAKLEGKDIPLVSRYSIQRGRKENRRKLSVSNTQILLVEDNPINQMVATEYLEGYGCTVTPAGNGYEALAQIESREFDAVFMDCQMPEMDGFEATLRIRKWEISKGINTDKRVPVIAFTANAMQSDKNNCYASGMDDFMSKPIGKSDFEAMLKKWLPHKTQSPDETCESDKIKENLIVKERVVPQLKQVTDKQFNIDVFNELRELFEDEFQFAVDNQISNILTNIEIVKEAIENEDFVTLERSAHSIKGVGSQFGAMRLAAYAKNIEEYARMCDRESVLHYLPMLIEEQAVVAELMLKQLHIDS